MSTAALSRTVDAMGWRWENTYAQLPGAFFSRARPAAVRAPALVVLNDALASAMGLTTEGVSADALAALFAGQVIPEGADPLAQAYAGHQFGGFTILGDGRAILLGEHRTPDGRLLDVQFKGSGETPFSRRGDGRAALGPMLREYVISEAMHALGSPTTRSLAVVTTGEPVYRDRRLRGAVLTRVASSHVRVGTFEYFAAHRDVEGLRTLVKYVIGRHYPELAERDDATVALLEAVMRAQAALIAQWQAVGFVHGVMNTDNMAVSGETLDYGPCAFLDTYKSAQVFSSIDQWGRYAYDQQPAIAQWNLARFAEAMLPLIDPVREAAIERAREVVSGFPELFTDAWMARMQAKIGFASPSASGGALVARLLAWMEETSADFTGTFRRLADGVPVALGDEAFAVWEREWRTEWLAQGLTLGEVRQRMQAVNPVVIPRNHAVEEALAAAEGDDVAPLHALLASVTRPFDDGAWHDGLREPNAAGDEPYRTFCGT
jgi:serine/tyrosine/threonine adenylyltransferase